MKTLSDPSHRFKVRKNAEQLNLSGLCIFHPSFSMVYVEGATKYIRNYKRLMLHRIQWTEAARARGEEEVELEGEPGEGENGETATTSASRAALSSASGPEGEYGAGSLEDNRCDLIWEGQIRERAFKAFRPRSCPTDAAAKEALGVKMVGYWDQAKNWKPTDDEL